MVIMAVTFKEQRSGIEGEILDDFKLIKEIGRGGMGRVYEAEQLSLQRRVAVKTLPLTKALSTSNLKRFKCEAMVAAQLKHPNIVNVYSVGCDQGIDYYAMEFIDGRNLAEIISEVRESRSSIRERTVEEAEFASACDTIEWTPPADSLVDDTENSPSTIEKLESSELLSSVRANFSHSGGPARELRGKRLTGWYSDFVPDLTLQVTEALKLVH